MSINGFDENQLKSAQDWINWALKQPTSNHGYHFVDNMINSIRHNKILFEAGLNLGYDKAPSFDSNTDKPLSKLENIFDFEDFFAGEFNGTRDNLQNVQAPLYGTPQQKLESLVLYDVGQEISGMMNSFNFNLKEQIFSDNGQINHGNNSGANIAKDLCWEFANPNDNPYTDHNLGIYYHMGDKTVHDWLSHNMEQYQPIGNGDKDDNLSWKGIIPSNYVHTIYNDVNNDAYNNQWTSIDIPKDIKENNQYAIDHAKEILQQDTILEKIDHYLTYPEVKNDLNDIESDLKTIKSIDKQYPNPQITSIINNDRQIIRDDQKILSKADYVPKSNPWSDDAHTQDMIAQNIQNILKSEKMDNISSIKQYDIISSNINDDNKIISNDIAANKSKAIEDVQFDNRIGNQEGFMTAGAALNVYDDAPFQQQQIVKQLKTLKNFANKIHTQQNIIYNVEQIITNDIKAYDNDQHNPLINKLHQNDIANKVNDFDILYDIDTPFENDQDNNKNTLKKLVNQENDLISQEDKIFNLPIYKQLIRDDLELDAINHPSDRNAIANYLLKGETKNSFTDITSQMEKDIDDGNITFNQIAQTIISDPDYSGKNNTKMWGKLSKSQLLEQDLEGTIAYNPQTHSTKPIIKKFSSEVTHQLEINLSQGDLSRAGLENEIKLQTSIGRTPTINYNQYKTKHSITNRRILSNIYSNHQHNTHIESDFDNDL